jgi:membrane dipeptidase
MLQELINYSFQYLDTISLIKERSALKQFYTQVSDDPGYILLLENADVLADWPCQNLWDTGIFCVGLTHIGHNRLADGNGVDWPQGLSKTGEIVVKALDHEKMILDLAHLAEPGFWEVMDLFSGPMMTSHTGFRKFFDVPRNLSEQQLAEIIIRDGMVGLTINPEMFGQPQIKVEDLFRHVDWFVQKFGCDHIGIGTDLGGFELTGEECSEYTCLQELAAYCEKAGYSQAEIQQILGGNWYSFLGKYLP